jgi:hypothetical protein
LIAGENLEKFAYRNAEVLLGIKAQKWIDEAIPYHVHYGG